MPRQSRSPAPRRSARQSGAAAPPPQPLPERGSRARVAQAAPRAAPVAAGQGANVQADQLEINKLQGNVLEAVKALVDAEKSITSRAPPLWNTIPNPCKDTISCLIQQTQSLITGAGNSDVTTAFRNVRGKCIGTGVDVYSLCGNLLTRNEINAVAFMIDTLNNLAVVMQIQGGLIGEIQTGRLRSNWRNEYPYRVWRYSTSRAVIATSAACLLGLLTTAVVRSYYPNQWEWSTLAWRFVHSHGGLSFTRHPCRRCDETASSSANRFPNNREPRWRSRHPTTRGPPVKPRPFQCRC